MDPMGPSRKPNSLGDHLQHPLHPAKVVEAVWDRLGGVLRLAALVADLVVDQVTSVSSGLSGQPIPMNWTVRNAANNLTFVKGWRDLVILSRDADPATTMDNQSLGSFAHSGELDFDESYTATHAVNLPDDASGSYTVFVCTDSINQVFEGATGNDNN